MLATFTDQGEGGIGGRAEEDFGGQVHPFIPVFIFLFDKLNPSSPSTCTQATGNAHTHAAYTGRLHSGPDTRTLGSLGREDRRGPTDGVPGVVTWTRGRAAFVVALAAGARAVVQQQRGAPRGGRRHGGAPARRARGHVHAYGVREVRGEEDPCAPVHVTVGDGGNRERLAGFRPAGRLGDAFREASFGHGRLEVVNATRALCAWHRNDDDEPVLADQVWITSLAANPACHRNKN